MLSRTLLASSLVAASAVTVVPAGAEEIKIRMASGHAQVQTAVNLMSTFLGPEIKMRVEARTPHKVQLIEGYGGSMVKPADVLEGVQTGIVDIGHWFFPFEPSNVPLHSFQALVPFGTMVAVDSVKIARAVFDKVPFLQKTLEGRFNQTLIALSGDNGYNIITNFDWTTLDDLKGKKISGAGINLNWLKFAGVIPVQASAPEVYTSLKTGVYQGTLIFPSIPVNLKWYEVAKFYTLVGFGSITWQGLTMNKARMDRLPKDVQAIVLEVGREYEAMTAVRADADYPKQLDILKSNGVAVKAVPESVRLAWAQSLAKWPQEVANELKGKGMPAGEVLNLVIVEAEKLGYKWPVRYEIK